MKKRILSGAVMTAISILILILGLKVQTQIITAFIAIVAALGVIELIGNAAKLENMAFKLLSAIYTVIMVFLFSIITQNVFQLNCSDHSIVEIHALVAAIIISVLYVIVCGVLTIIYEEQFDLSKIAVICGMPIIYSFAFSTLSSMILATGGIYYLLLVLNFSCICDIGAYFVGVNLGKTKLCPKISPNKTVEGALGGIVSSVVASLVITLCFGYFNKLIPALLLTIPLCAVGMAGDLFASVIKRKSGLKDFGNLIPGHGGILDRLDSMLFVAPLLYCLLILGVI